MTDQLLGSGRSVNDSSQPPQPLQPPAELCADAELAQRATTGDREALGELYSRYATDVTAVCAVRGPAHEIGDLVHDTFVALLTTDELDEPAKVRNWLLRTAGHIAIDAVRAHRNSRAGTLPHGINHAGPRAPSTAADDPSATAIDRATLRDLLAQLDDRDAAIFVEHYGQGTPFTALAETFATTPGAIRTRMHRARRKLQAFAASRGLTRLIPAPLLRLIHRSRPLQAISEPVLAALLPVIAGIGLTAAIIQTPAADANTKELQPAQNSAPASAPSNQARQHTMPLPAAAHRPSPTGAPNGNATDGAGGWSWNHPPLVEADPIHMPAGTGQVSTQPDSPPDYEFGADSGITIDDRPVDVAVTIHDEPTVEPAAAAACPTADSTPATYCHGESPGSK